MNMSETLETYCNKSCNKPFTIDRMKTVKLNFGIEKTYFKCPHCNHEYDCFYTDKSIRKMQIEMRQLQYRLRSVNENAIAKLIKDTNSLHEKITHAMGALRKKLERHE